MLIDLDHSAGNLAHGAAGKLGGLLALKGGGSAAGREHTVAFKVQALAALHGYGAALNGYRTAASVEGKLALAGLYRDAFVGSSFLVDKAVMALNPPTPLAVIDASAPPAKITLACPKRI